MGHYYDCPECGEEKHGVQSTCKLSPWKAELKEKQERKELGGQPGVEGK